MKNLTQLLFLTTSLFLITSCSNSKEKTTSKEIIAKEVLKPLIQKPKEEKSIPEIVKTEGPLKNCLDIVTEIVITSSHFRKSTKGLNEKIVENGGISYGIMLESSPNPIDDEAEDEYETYNFNLHETYPDHSPVIERYKFDPAKKLLYLFNPIEDEFHEIEFDKKLLKELSKSYQE